MKIIEEGVDGQEYAAAYYQTDKGNYLHVNGYYFLKNTVSQNTISWRCTCYRSYKCKARAKIHVSRPTVAVLGYAHHSHDQTGQRNITRQKLTPKDFVFIKNQNRGSANATIE
jgi:hypothetical protein